MMENSRPQPLQFIIWTPYLDSTFNYLLSTISYSFGELISFEVTVALAVEMCAWKQCWRTVVGLGQRDAGTHRRRKQATDAWRTNRVPEVNPRSGSNTRFLCWISARKLYNEL